MLGLVGDDGGLYFEALGVMGWEMCIHGWFGRYG